MVIHYARRGFAMALAEAPGRPSSAAAVGLACLSWSPAVLPGRSWPFPAYPGNGPGPLPLAVVRAMDPVVRVAGIRQAPIAQFADGLLEVVQRLEAPVDGGEPEVGDLVKVAERPEDG
jgi:hypothetical protein